MTQKSLNKQNIYLLTLENLEQSSQYQLVINDDQYYFSSPQNVPKNSMRIYMPILETLNTHKLILLNSNHQILIEQIIPTVINYKDPMFVNIFDDLITEIKLETIPGAVGKIGNGYYYHDYQLKIQIDLNNNLYWLDPNDPNWGWIYGYVYFKLNSDNLSDKLITNMDENFKLVYIGQAESANIYRLISKNTNNIEIIAFIDTYSPAHKLEIEQSKPTDQISFGSQKNINTSENALTNQQPITDQETKSLSINIPIYFQVDKNCQYSNEYINNKVIFKYDLNNAASFKYNQKIPDSNVADNQIEMFTSAIPMDKKLYIGSLTLDHIDNNWRNTADIEFDFINHNQMDRNIIHIYAQNPASPELKAILTDTDHDFDINGLHCHIQDDDLQVYISCTCH